MRFFSDCWDCHHCSMHYTCTCLAGHGDDDFEKVTKKLFDDLLHKEDYSDSRKEELKKYFSEYMGDKENV